MNVFKVYIKAYALNPERYKILQTGVQILYSYLSGVIKYANQTLKHTTYNDAMIIYGSYINYSDLSGTEHILLNITPESYARKYLKGGPNLKYAAGVTKLIGEQRVFSEIMWSFIEEADNKPLALANYAFHELVHNKAYAKYKGLKEQEDFVHKNSGEGVLAEVVRPKQAGNMSANAENIKTMAEVYALPIEQFRVYLAVEPKIR